MRRFISLLVVFIAIFTTVQPVEACDPTPPKPEYLDCEDLGSGYRFGFRVRSAPNDRFRFTSSYGTLTGGAPKDPDNWVRISDSNGYVFDWEASLGIDAVIVNAGGKSRVIKESEDKDGNNYHGKTDSRGKPYKITSVEFCYDYELSVDANATGVAATGSTWQILKGLAVPRLSRFAGETAKFDYAVAVTKTTAGESGYRVQGGLEIRNDTPISATIAHIRDRLQPGDLHVSIDCGGIELPYKLSAGKTLTCTFNESLNQKLEGEYTIRVETRGSVGGDSDSAAIEWTTSADGPTGPATVTITDTQAAFGGPYTISADSRWEYAVDAACPADPALYTNGVLTTVIDNTATIVETAQSASAQAVLDCYLPTIAQVNDTSMVVKYSWGIEKIGSVNDLILDLNEMRPVDYTVTLSVLSKVETSQKITGQVTITNPNPTTPVTGTLAAEPVPGIPGVLIDCVNPITIPAGGAQTCQYQAFLGASQPGTSSALFTFNNLTVAHTAPFTFETAKRNEIDECVTVTDDKYGPLGQVCAADAPKQYAYTMELGGLTSCTAVPYNNTATFTAVDTLAQGASSWLVYLQPDCPSGGCVNVIDYWLEHANPANYDSTWDKVVPAGPNSPFFETGSTWVQTLSRLPEMGGDPNEAIYQALSREYIGATLNMLQYSTMPPEVGTAIGQAQALLETYDTDRSSIDEATFAQMVALQEMLHSYNNGELGPEVCCD